MKIQNLFLAGAFVGMLSACSSEEIMEPAAQEGNQISFGVTADRNQANTQGRAADINTSSNIAFNKFMVSALVHGTENTYFTNQVYQKDQNANTWRAVADPYFWHSSGLDFFAHVIKTPDGSDGTGCHWNDGKPTIQFTVADNPAEQQDLLVAYKEGVKGSDGKCSLNFRHALSQVVFQAVNVSDKINIVIDDIRLIKVANSGTFSYFYKETPDATETKVINTEPNVKLGEEATANSLPIATWGSRTPSTTTFQINLKDAENKGISVGTDEANPTSLTNGSSNISKALLMIPQELEVKNKADGFHFRMKLHITSDNGMSIWEDDAIIPLPATMTWLPGVKYVYTFKFDNSAGYDPSNPENPTIYPITFDVTVDDYAWTEMSSLQSGTN